ncbi:D-glycero-beta-D-manno-heptose 1-phosphate adenylyltransferase [Solitalea canadensis]|uniref:D-glycero-beta-D-manno-heptose 1-phosphate adenylyltransferase n=1 Tax=Solitalea canadensis (strain ATCC 29591 / DSM 3403 / JCM 21819 / LMG 8368 / NBRC 15130 / NCIMB 12057 / USAM 9D) TaxID=929556 RepID=H8KXG8_SOLCM|nr:D-glycero-beta-D-manno-heptose 1-phosphate adenylyltransferase [Solitalea canadensis]AFD08497.1 D-heptose-1-phosphate adenylyltransferase [Solitalea canadensis DSM 3403]
MDNNHFISSKIVTKEELKRKIAIWQFLNEKVVFTNGCFDLLHLGHVDYLSKAADLGNHLVIGLNSDASTTNLKGPNRPIQDEHSRAMLLAAIGFVDAVVLFDEETPFELIKFLQPDVLVKGSDYTIDKIVGADVVLGRGGEVKTINYIDGYSTSAIEKKIRQQ